MPDITRNLDDPESVSIDMAAQSPTDCPSLTVYEGYQLMITGLKDENGLPVSGVADYAQVAGVEIRSSVFEPEKAGAYTLEFVAGLSTESLSELQTRIKQILVLNVIGPVPDCDSIVPLLFYEEKSLVYKLFKDESLIESFMVSDQFQD